MRLILIALSSFLLTVSVSAQEPDLCEPFVEVDLELCGDLRDLEAKKVKLLKQQQDWNNASVIWRRAHYNARIQKIEEKVVEVGDKPKLVQHLEAKRTRLVELRESYDSTEEGSPRDEAFKLGPQISELSQLIGQLKEQLGIE